MWYLQVALRHSRYSATKKLTVKPTSKFFLRSAAPSSQGACTYASKSNKAPPTSSTNKRALNESQIQGSSSKTTSPTVPPAGTKNSNDNNNLLIGGSVLLIGGLAAAYSMKVFPFSKKEETSQVAAMPKKEDEKKQTELKKEGKVPTEKLTIKKESVEQKVSEKKTSEEVSKVKKEETTGKKSDEKEVAIVEIIEEETKKPSGESWKGVSVAAMLQSNLATEKNPSQITETISLPTHDPDGNRVSISLVSETSAEETEPQYNALEAASELQATTLSEANEQVTKALKLLRVDVDQSYALSDIDTLSEPELKLRLIQLSSELTDRARYEALRTKESLVLLEKEISQKYLDIISSQKNDFEDVLARKLREQENELEKKKFALMQEKDESLSKLLQASLDAQAEEHKLNVEILEEQLQQKLNQQYSIKYEEQLKMEKEKFVGQMQEMTQSFESLQQHVAALEQDASFSKAFQIDSLKAHKICAAALALTDKLAIADQSVALEVQALKSLVDEHGVIGTALKSLPKSALSTGVPSTSELQVRFTDHVHSSARKAAMVPKGKYDLGNQLFGLFFASITFPPTPCFSYENISDDDTYLKTDLALSNAYYYTNLGQLEDALKELNTKVPSDSQANISLQDWKCAANDRILVEKVRKIIQMECAMLNATMGYDK